MQPDPQNQLIQQLLGNQQEANITSANRRDFFTFYATAAAAAAAPAADDDALATDAIKAAKKHGFKIDTGENTKLASLYYCMRVSWQKIAASNPSQSEFYSNKEAKDFMNSHLAQVKAMFSCLIGSEAEEAKQAKNDFLQELDGVKDNSDENFEISIEAAKQTYRQKINSRTSPDEESTAGQSNGPDQKQEELEKNKKLEIEMMNAIAHEYMFAIATIRASCEGGCVARYKGKVQALTLGLDEVKQRYVSAQGVVTSAKADLKQSAQIFLDSRRPGDALTKNNQLSNKIKAIFNALAGSKQAWETLPGDKKVTFAGHALQVISGRYRFKLENKHGSYCAKVVSTSWFSLKRNASGDIFAQMHDVVMDNQPRSIEQLKKDEALEHAQNNRFGGAEARNKALEQKYKDQMRANAPQSVMQGGAEAAHAQMEAARASQAAAAPKP